jgi:hypothetical protein
MSAIESVAPSGVLRDFLVFPKLCYQGQDVADVIHSTHNARGTKCVCVQWRSVTFSKMLAKSQGEFFKV